MDMESHFDRIDDRVVRYLEKKWVDGGGSNVVTIMPEDIRRDNGLDAEQSARILARFEQLGIVETIADDGTLCINSIVCQYVAELDHRPRDYLHNAKKWSLSKPWLVYPFIVLLFLFFWRDIIQMLKSLLE